MTTFGGCIAAAITVPSGVTIDVTTNGGGPTAVTITAGDYDSILAFLTQIAADLTAQRPVSGGAWSLSSLSAAGAAPQLTIAVTNWTFSITWTSTELRDLLGFAANIAAQASATGAAAVRGVWQPDCPIFMPHLYRAAPRETDARQTKGPTGHVVTRVGNARYCHANLQWQNVPANKLWRAEEDADNESLQQFLDDTQWGFGHTWFSVGSRCVIMTNGSGDWVTNWSLCGFRKLTEIVQRSDNTNGWDGLWSVAIPKIVSDGT